METSMISNPQLLIIYIVVSDPCRLYLIMTLIGDRRGMNVTADQISARVRREFLERPIMDNALRGYWCEAMVAEALGPECRIVSDGWNPWDLQVGPDGGSFPERIRLQVKNSAARQTWHGADDAPSASSFTMTWRAPPFYLARDNAAVPCEDEGFLCEMFVLCHHPVSGANADQRDPRQWNVYLVPVIGALSAVTDAEVAWCREKLARTGKPGTTQRRVETLEKGIRGRPPIRPRRVEDLSVDLIKSLLQARERA